MLIHNLEKNFIDGIKSTINLRSNRIKQSQSFQVSINGRKKDYFEGLENCSNQCYAIASYLLDYDLDIIQILPKASCLNRDGHSFLLFKPSNLLYDPLLNKFYQFVQLPKKLFKIIDNSQNPSQYVLDFNSVNLFLGIISGYRIKNYLNSMNKLNFLDFPGAINVIIHEYLAIIFYSNPNILVSDSYYDEVFHDSNFKFYHYIGITNIVLVRLFLTSSIIFILYNLFALIRNVL